MSEIWDVNGRTETSTYGGCVWPTRDISGAFSLYLDKSSKYNVEVDTPYSKTNYGSQLTFMIRYTNRMPYPTVFEVFSICTDT